MQAKNIDNKKILERLSIQKLNEMQEECAKAYKKNNDLLLISPTGSGKTLAFLLPMLAELNPDRNFVQTLILTPARELSLQIETVFKSMGTNFKVNCCYGGHPMSTEKNNLKTPPAVLIGTPGRIADHIRRGNFDCRYIKTLILDEFDKSLELGFQKEMQEVTQALPSKIKKVLTSATNKIEIPEFAKLNSVIALDFIPNAKPIALTQKKVISVEKDKLATLFQLVCHLGNQPSLVFCNHREAVERIGKHFINEGIQCDVFHGGLEQDDRERALLKFRNGSHNLLIVTDLASRGLDIPEIENVIHYQLPRVEEAFIHRNGRTARMNAKGTSYLVLAEEETPPEFIPDDIEILELTEDKPLPAEPEWETLYVCLGRKEKINKIDLVGFFCKVGNLKKEELGKIDVLDHSSFVAVKRGIGEKLARKLRNERIKKKSVRIQVSY